MANDGEWSRRVVLAALAAGSAEAAFGQGASVSEALPATIKLVGSRDQVIVEALIGGKPAMAMVDNGFSISAVDKAFAEANKLGGERRRSLMNGEEAMRAPGVMLQLGALTIFVNPSLVDLSEPARYAEQPIKAVIGMEVFNASLVGLDFSAGEMTLRARQFFAGPPGARGLALRSAPGRKHSTTIRINGASVRAMVDLGFSSPLAVSPALAEKLGLLKGRSSSTRMAAQFSGESVVRRYWGVSSVETMEFAGEKFADVPVDITPTEGAGPFADHDAVIGLPLLSRFDLVFDTPALRLWTSRTDRVGAPFERRYTGLQTERSARETFMVVHVAPGSPAEKAGFQTFDIISQMDGAPMTSRRLREVREGQRVTFRLENGVERTLAAARYY